MKLLSELTKFVPMVHQSLLDSWILPSA